MKSFSEKLENHAFLFSGLTFARLFNSVENTELWIMITTVGKNIPTGDIVIKSVD